MPAYKCSNCPRSGKCRKCQAAYLQDWRKRRKKEQKCQRCGEPSDSKVHCRACRLLVKEQQKVWEAAGLCNQCGKRPRQKRCKKCPTCAGYGKTCRTKNRLQGLCPKCGQRQPAEGFEQCWVCLEQNKAIRQQARLDAIQAYGGACACCGETTIEFLHVDHKHNDGGKHRKEIGTGGAIHWWAKKHGYPDTLQVLCANCHNAKSYYGYCPHQLSKEAHDAGNSRTQPSTGTAP